MRPVLLFLVLGFVASAPAQEGGRDGGRNGGSTRPVVFVRCEKTAESKGIYLAAWQALEPFTEMTRRRLVTLPAGGEAAAATLAEHADARLFVALDHAAAVLVRARNPEAKVLEVSPAGGAHVRTRVDRLALARLVRKLRPDARGVVARPPQELPGFRTGGTDGDVFWIAEGGTAPETIDVACVVSTSPSVPSGRAVLAVRPDPVGAGLQVAAMVVARVRDGRTPSPSRVRRLHVAVDLRVAKARGVRVPLDVLARADEVRRAP